MPDLAQDSLRRAVAAAGIDADPVFFPEVGSTNTQAIGLAEDGVPEWTVVATNHQTAGRGRLGRTWSTPPGRALTFSLILRPRLAPDRAALLSLLAAERMASACEEVAGIEVRTEWPNDLLIGSRKVAGVLLEAAVAGARLEQVVVGIGVNLTMEAGDFPPGLRERATSLALGGVEDVPPDRLLEAFLRGFRSALGDPAFPDGVVERYAARCATLGRCVRAATLAGVTIEGRASRVLPDGGLVVLAGGEEHAVGFGEVKRLD